MSITDNDLSKLPVGGQFQAKDGNATATVTKTDTGYNFSANCDSLTFLINELTTEVYHYKQSNSALVTKLEKKETTGLSGWQNFQIYGFRIVAAILLLFYLYNRYKPKLFNK